MRKILSIDAGGVRGGIECGRWCLKGRKAEDGEIAANYPLVKNPSAAFAQRTEWNVPET
jgi:hypothetical protein